MNRLPTVVTICLFVLISLLVAACGSAEPTPGPTSVPPPTGVPATQPSPTQAPPTQVPPTQPPPTVASPSAVPPSPTPEPTALPSPGSGFSYDDRGSPSSLLASYANAINRREYERAWGYWSSPPNPTFEDFRQGFAETHSVLLAIRPPTLYDGAAGSTYAPVPALLLATHTDGSRHSFVGCYVARRQNVDPAADTGWWLFDATVSAAARNSTNAGLLRDACADLPEPGPEEFAFDDRSDPALLLGSYVNAINRQEYERAWGYWQSPPNPTFEDFRQGFAETESVLLMVQPPTDSGAAAGSMYAAVPSLLLAAHRDGSQHSFLACYVVRRSNVPPEDDPPVWWLYEATVRDLGSAEPDAGQLPAACADR